MFDHTDRYRRIFSSAGSNVFGALIRRRALVPSDCKFFTRWGLRRVYLERREGVAGERVAVHVRRQRQLVFGLHLRGRHLRHVGRMLLPWWVRERCVSVGKLSRSFQTEPYCVSNCCCVSVGKLSTGFQTELYCVSKQQQCWLTGCTA